MLLLLESQGRSSVRQSRVLSNLVTYIELACMCRGTLSLKHLMHVLLPRSVMKLDLSSILHNTIFNKVHANMVILHMSSNQMLSVAHDIMYVFSS